MTEAEAASARGQTLSQKVEELAVLESMQTGGYELAETAKAPTVAFNIHTNRNAVIGLILGLVLGVIVASILQVFDKRIKDEDTFETEFGVPVIASIPLVGKKWSRVTESVHVLRSGTRAWLSFARGLSNAAFESQVLRG